MSNANVAPDEATGNARCTACFTPAGDVICDARCDHTRCHDGWYSKPRGDGLVWCCSRWRTPADAFDHSADAYSGWDRDL